ncbi:MAG: IS30 family transposase [Pseudomonadota bacterium]
MRRYNQLTYEQRCQIEVLNKSYFTHAAIAQAMGVHQSTISRELQRNTGLRGYRHDQAQRRTCTRRRATHLCVKMTDSFIDEIEDKLYQRWSPEQISGWFKTEKNIRISHERIYQYIWNNKYDGGDLHAYLRRRGKKYQFRGSNGKTSRGQIKNRVSIDQRPKIVEEKTQIGHWEIDTMIGKNHSGALVTIVERVTRFTVSTRVNRKDAQGVCAATIRLLLPYKDQVLTITSDNGKEFAYHEKIAKAIECDFYFAHPYHSRERGLNENTNGLIRQYFPKQTDFKKVSQREVVQAIEALNNWPRKVLGFNTPNDVMQKYKVAQAA